MTETNYRWISVEEALPQPFVSVLGYMPEEKPLPAVHECYYAEVRGGEWFSMWLYRAQKVTHWMPMPEAPEEAKDAPDAVNASRAHEQPTLNIATAPIAAHGWTEEALTMANERRLIDANALPVITLKDNSYWERHVVYKSDVDAAPTVDAVEVVRCEECRYSTAPLCHKEYCKEKGILECDKPGGIAFNRRVYSTDFCSYGEKSDTQPQREDA